MNERDADVDKLLNRAHTRCSHVDEADRPCESCIRRAMEYAWSFGYGEAVDHDDERHENFLMALSFDLGMRYETLGYAMAACSYCDWKLRGIKLTGDNQNDTSHLRNHVENDCPNHPMRKLEARIRELEGRQGKPLVLTADMVRALRERTGAGMMDCKKALMECTGDMDKSVEWLDRRGQAGFILVNRK
jgi:hypothetical protein